VRKCHARIYNTNSARPGIAMIRAGTLDASDQLDTPVHIWVKRKQRGYGYPTTPRRLKKRHRASDRAAARPLALLRQISRCQIDLSSRRSDAVVLGAVRRLGNAEISVFDIFRSFQRRRLPSQTICPLLIT